VLQSMGYIGFNIMEFIYSICVAIIVLGLVFLPLSRINTMGVHSSKIEMIRLWEPIIPKLTLAAIIVLAILTVLDLA